MLYCNCQSMLFHRLHFILTDVQHLMTYSQSAWVYSQQHRLLYQSYVVLLFGIFLFKRPINISIWTVVNVFTSERIDCNISSKDNVILKNTQRRDHSSFQVWYVSTEMPVWIVSFWKKFQDWSREGREGNGDRSKANEEEREKKPRSREREREREETYCGRLWGCQLVWPGLQVRKKFPLEETAT